MAKTAGSSLSWGVLLGLGAAVAVTPAGQGCAPIEHKEEADWIDSVVISDVLMAVGSHVVAPGLVRFDAALVDFEVALADWGDAVGSSDADPAQQLAQDRWIDAMLIWQELEVAQVGPAGSSLTAVAGEDVRDEIYSWPTVNPCRVDQEIVSNGWLDEGWFDATLVNSYGLDALEHLVYGGEDNACPGQVDINADGTWQAMTPDEVDQQRVAFGLALTDHLRQQSQDLAERWSPEAGNFSGALALAGSSPYASAQEALNAVFDALFYLELVTKDRKLAQPLGLSNCSTTTCPDDAEHLISGISGDAIVANLVGFERLFTGGEGAGLDDLLRDLGHAELSDEILAEVAVAIETAEQSGLAVHDGVESNPAEMRAVYDAVKGVTDLLKGDLVTVLALTIPSEAAGDND